jgi:hypothetical protein
MIHQVLDYRDKIGYLNNLTGSIYKQQYIPFRLGVEIHNMID